MASKGDLTRQSIIEKSMQLFSVKGYFNTSIDAIVKATGITKGGLYGHFRNKEEIWYAVYDQCVQIWKDIVFRGVRDLTDPLARINRVLENVLKDYLGGGVFEGGCFLLNSLVELSGQAPAMSNHVLSGFQRLAGLLRAWLEEAESQGKLRAGLDLQGVANFLVVALNGTVPMYAAGKDPLVWQQTLAQLQVYLAGLRRNN